MNPIEQKSNTEGVSMILNKLGSDGFCLTAKDKNS